MSTWKNILHFETMVAGMNMAVVLKNVALLHECLFPQLNIIEAMCEHASPDPVIQVQWTHKICLNCYPVVDMMNFVNV